MNNFVILLVKAFHEGESRLSGVLSLEERQTLTFELYCHTFDVLKQLPIKQIIIISRDKMVCDHARANGLLTHNANSAHPNEAVTGAYRLALHGAENVIIIPSDLPTLTVADVQKFLAVPERVVISPDRRYDDTNAICLRSIPSFTFRYGEDGFSRHLAEAKTQKQVPQVFFADSFELDLDTPADWLHYQRRAAGRMR